MTTNGNSEELNIPRITTPIRDDLNAVKPVFFTTEEDIPASSSESKEVFTPIPLDFPLLSTEGPLTSPVRFNIMLLLYNFTRLGFPVLRQVLQLTPGNLEHHLKTLINAGLVEDRIKFSPRPLKVYGITTLGREKFKQYFEKLRDILERE